MGKFDGILICTDLDGTLINSDGEVSNANAEAIQYFTSNGGRFTFCSGRTPKSLRGLEKKLQTATPVIGLNGSAIYDFATESFIHHQPLDESVIEPFTYVIKKNPDIIAEIMIQNLEDGWSYRRNKDSSFDSIYKILAEKQKHDIFFVFDTEEYTISLRKEMLAIPEFERFDFIRSWPICFEIVDKNGNKGAGVKALKNHLGNITKTICIGDNENDLAMIAYADIGYAVANACEELKAAADRITVSNDDSAIAKIISEL